MAKKFTYLGSVSERTKEIVSSELGKPGKDREWLIEENPDGSIDATLFDNARMQGVSRRTLNEPEDAEEDDELEESWIELDRRVGGLGKEAEKYLRPSLDEDIAEEEELEEEEEEEEDDKAIKVTKKAKKVVSGAKVSVDDQPEDDDLLEEELSFLRRRYLRDWKSFGYRSRSKGPTLYHTS